MANNTVDRTVGDRGRAVLAVHRDLAEIRQSPRIYRAGEVGEGTTSNNAFEWFGKDRGPRRRAREMMCDIVARGRLLNRSLGGCE